LANVMSIYTEDQLPVITTLAKEFTSCTNFFAAVPGPTVRHSQHIHEYSLHSSTRFLLSHSTQGPNRLFVHAATSKGYNAADFDHPETNARSIYEDLIENQPSYDFRIRYHDFTTAHGLQPLATKYKQYFQQDLGFQQFFYDVDTGSLPSYTFLVPLLGPLNGMWPTTQHPSFE
jgi:phospholipase C